MHLQTCLDEKNDNMIQIIIPWIYRALFSGTQNSSQRCNTHHFPSLNIIILKVMLRLINADYFNSLSTSLRVNPKQRELAYSRNDETGSWWPVMMPAVVLKEITFCLSKALRHASGIIREGVQQVSAPNNHRPQFLLRHAPYFLHGGNCLIPPAQSHCLPGV